MVTRQPCIELLGNNLATGSGACCLLNCLHFRLPLIFWCRYHPVGRGTFSLSCGIVMPKPVIYFKLCNPSMLWVYSYPLPPLDMQTTSGISVLGSLVFFSVYLIAHSDWYPSWSVLELKASKWETLESPYQAPYYFRSSSLRASCLVTLWVSVYTWQDVPLLVIAWTYCCPAPHCSVGSFIM